MASLPFMPDWQAIQISEIWAVQVHPWVSQMYQDALEEKAPPLPGGENATLECYHYWRGFCAALKLIRDMPSDAIEADRVRLAQEKERETIQARRDAGPRAHS